MASAVRQLRRLILLLAILCVCACNNNNNGEAAEKDSDETANAVKADEKKTNGKADVPKVANDIYPGFPLDAFNAEEKARVVKLNKAELCPCPDSSESLHECMQKEEKQCDLARQSLNMIGGMLKADYNDTDVLDGVAEFLEAAKAVHEFNLEGRPVKGSPDAKVIIVEFADFECPHCKMAAAMFDEVSAKYGDKIGVYFKQYPLPLHLNAAMAARAALAAHKQGKFWKMHDQLFKHQKSLSEDKIISIAQRLGLNMGKFKTDLESKEIGELVQADRKDGEDSGLTGTPTIYINGRRYLGETSTPKLSQAIDEALANANKTETTTN